MGTRLITSRLAGDAIAISRSLTAPEAFAAIFDGHSRRFTGTCPDGSAATGPMTSRRTHSPWPLRGERASARRLRRPAVVVRDCDEPLSSDRRAEQRLLETIARLGADVSSDSVTPDGAALNADCDLAAALAKLDPSQRDVLLLYAWAELSYEEIAASLGNPARDGAIEALARRASLRAELEAGAVAATPAGTGRRQEAS